MTDLEIFKSIAENLSERKSSVALSNYLVLSNNIKYVNDLFASGINSLNVLQSQVDFSIKNDNYLNDTLKDDTQPLFYFRKIVPRILLNDISVCEKFITYTQPDNRQGITIDNVGNLSKEFIDYNNLVTSARQFIDSMVADAYQLLIFEPKETNYQVLVSLNSFNKYVTPSIRQVLFNPQIENSLTEFEGLNYNQWANSPITKCSCKTFPEKVDYLFHTLNIITEDVLKDEIKNLFKFSSEFTHIGYVSTFFTSTNGKEVIFGDEIGPYLPSTENFSELKYEILETAINFFYKIYLYSLLHSFKKIFVPDTFWLFERAINNLSAQIAENFKTRNNKYFFFITEGLVGSDKTIPLTCMCGKTNLWQPPHDLTKIYCSNCGSTFTLEVLSGDPGYIITRNGPIKVIGSSAPDFNDLPIAERNRILKLCEEAFKKTL